MTDTQDTDRGVWKRWCRRILGWPRVAAINWYLDHFSEDPIRRGLRFHYGVISYDPPILNLMTWDEGWRMYKAMRALFEHLRAERVDLFINYGWDFEYPRRIARSARLERRHRRRHPKHRIVHLCNTQRQTEMFQDAGLHAIFFNHNTVLDERIYRPLPDVEKPFDTVYDARLNPFKRHHLAAKVASLALIYYTNPGSVGSMYSQQTRADFDHAHWFNEETGRYRMLGPDEVNGCYNRCRVGLCLSEQEGAMYASAQYLLAGLPVVSTPSRGGRDVLFDERTGLIVEPDADAVRRGVEQMIARDLDPRQVREITLTKMREHRRRLVDEIQRILDEQNVPRSAAELWDEMFHDKLWVNYRPHAEVIERFEQIGRGA